jgi:fructose-1,6-bisphosphatase/inositol monophosphatase family enzyme
MPSKQKREATLLVVSLAVGLAAWWQHAERRRRRTNSNCCPHAVPKSLLQTPHSPQLQLAVRLALQAGENMVAHCDTAGTVLSQTLTLDFKGQPEDFCTQIDLQNEALVINAVRQHFPSHDIIGEESTGTGEIPLLSQNPTWIIDPIDGTTNFASGLPLACVSIGYCVDRRPVMGVVYAPMTKELYVAVRDYGAYRNGVKLRVEPTTTALRHAICNFEFGYSRSPEAVAKMVGALQRLLQHGCRATRCLGSGVLDLCFVATGKVDVVYAGVAGEGWKPWDYAAGLVICTEAGCSIESLIGDEGQELDIYAKSVICAGNQQLLQDARRVILEGL